MNQMQQLVLSVDQTEDFAELGWVEGMAHQNNYKWPGDDRMRPIAKALAEGKPVFNINSLFASAGITYADGIPILAICRGDEEYCVWEEGAQWDTFYSCGEREVSSFSRRWGMGHMTRSRTRSVQIDRISQADGAIDIAIARTPFVPQAARKDLAPHACFVVWEAEWQVEIPQSVPEDPALVTHLFGDWYALEATWDLSDTERRVFGL